MNKILLALSKKWMMDILEVLYGDNQPARMRFGELLKSLDGISQKVLSDKLKELEKLRIVERKAYAEVPPRAEYSLTAKGVCIYRSIEQLSARINIASGNDESN